MLQPDARPPLRRTARWGAALGVCVALLGCAAPPPTPEDAAWHAQLQRWQGTPLLLLGEQHDALAHQAWERDTVQWLATRQQLAALVIEMAEAGNDTRGLPPDASASQVREALRWNEAGWPWAHYGPVVMAAVRAGAPVLGGNLPRARQRNAMNDAALDGHLPPEALARQREAVRDGHCGLLPPGQIAPMTRVQLARDASLAATAQAALQAGRTVVLVAGAGHVGRRAAAPTWLAQNISYKVAVAQAGKAQTAIDSEADYLHRTPGRPERDYCAPLRQRAPAPA